MTKKPSRLWHYTSPVGALGILRDGEIRATMIHYLNDARELNYALDLAKEIIKSEGVEGGEEAAAFCAEFLDRIRNIAVYVASFSKKEDDLSQWRGYCPADGGHAVCFDVAALVSAAEKAGYQLAPCLYERDEQIRVLRPVIKRMLTDEGARSTKDLYDVYALEIATLSAKVKDEAFRDEQEWRLIAGPTQECDLVEYRENGALVIPYRNIELKGEADRGILEIMIGPHRHPELAARSLRMFTSREFGWPARITHSKAPFRSLN